MVQPGEYVLVFADGSGRMTQEGAFADFKLNGDGEGIYLFAPDGSPIQKVTYPTLGKDESFGVGSDARYAGPVPPEDVYRVLMSPTPGAPNSASKSAGPRVDVHNVKGPVKDGDIQVTAQVMTLPGTPVEAVTLTYVVDYATDQETTIPMDSNGDGTYSASIPAQKPGSMVRWYVMARDAAGTTRAPPFSTPTSREYYGTVIDDPSMNSTLPVIYMFCKNKTAPWVVDKGSSPGCSVMVQGTLYDNVIVRRRGVSSLNWPKPKIKIDAGDQGKVFQIYDSNGREVKEFNLNSEWAEPGENTFMRETLGWRTFADMGVDALQYYQAQVRLNGEYFGKFSVGEDWDEGPLAENGYTVSPVVGPLMKSISGEFSNLRWDLDPYLAQYYYRPITVKTQDSFDKLIDFANGLAGANGSRTDFVFDNVSLPKVINFMAAQTLVLNQDRCTKNFYVYQDPSSYQWSILPWDLESTFSTDRGLGGTPAPDYCILACEQWNSPLFCDRNHPQDLLVTTPWGLISTRVNPDRGRRRLMQSETMQSVGPDLVALIAQQQNTTEGSPMNGAAVQGLKLPSNSSIPANYDGDQRANPIPEGARGTYNFLIDTILSIPETRAMYVRRLRTLMDEYYETGRLVDLVTSEYEIIKDEAKRDAKFWGNIGDPERGYTYVDMILSVLKFVLIINIICARIYTMIILDNVINNPCLYLQAIDH